MIGRSFRLLAHNWLFRGLVRLAPTEEETLPDFDSLWDYDNPAATESKFREILPIAKESKNTSYQAQLLTQIARAEGLQRKFEAAHETLNQAESLLGASDTLTRVRYLLERGRVFNSSGKIQEARPLFLQAWELANTIHEEFYTIDAAHMMAIVETHANKMEWNLKALATADLSSEKRARRWRGSLYNNIGWDYFESKQYEKALEVFHKAMKAREEAEQIPEIRIAKWCIARALRALNRVSEAFEIQKGLLEESEKSGKRDSYVYEEMAECLIEMGRQIEAKRYFAAAYKELSKDLWLREKEPDRLKRLKELSTSG